MKKYFIMILIVSQCAVGFAAWAPIGKWYVQSVSPSGWKGGLGNVPGTIAPITPSGYAVSIVDYPDISEPLVERYGALPNRILWDNDTTRSFGALTFIAHLAQGVPTSTTWGDLRDYIFWKIKFVKGGQSFYTPVTQGDKDTIIVINPSTNNKLIGYHFFYVINDLSIPQTDTTAFHVTLNLFDQSDTTGSILRELTSFYVGRLDPVTGLDSLLWQQITRASRSESDNFSICSKIVVSLPTSQLAWNNYKEAAFSAKERTAYLKGVQQLIYLIENRIDSIPHGDYYNNFEDWVKEQAQSLYYLQESISRVYTNPLYWN